MVSRKGYYKACWIPNFIYFLYKMMEWRAIEGKRLIILILSEKLPFRKFGHIYLVHVNWRWTIYKVYVEDYKSDQNVQQWPQYFYPPACTCTCTWQLYSWVMSILRYMTCTHTCTCTCTSVCTCKCLIKSIISLVTVLQLHGHICYWHIKIIIYMYMYIFFLSLYM